MVTHVLEGPAHRDHVSRGDATVSFLLGALGTLLLPLLVLVFWVGTQSLSLRHGVRMTGFAGAGFAATLVVVLALSDGLPSTTFS